MVVVVGFAEPCDECSDLLMPMLRLVAQIEFLEWTPDNHLRRSVRIRAWTGLHRITGRRRERIRLRRS
jgi:hypothetical protein